jgi:hypothetical protein
MRSNDEPIEVFIRSSHTLDRQLSETNQVPGFPPQLVSLAEAIKLDPECMKFALQNCSIDSDQPDQ